MDEHGSILSLLTTRFILWNIENFQFNGKTHGLFIISLKTQPLKLGPRI